MQVPARPRVSAEITVCRVGQPPALLTRRAQLHDSLGDLRVHGVLGYGSKHALWLWSAPSPTFEQMMDGPSSAPEAVRRVRHGGWRRREAVGGLAPASSGSRRRHSTTRGPRAPPPPPPTAAALALSRPTARRPSSASASPRRPRTPRHSAPARVDVRGSRASRTTSYSGRRPRRCRLPLGRSVVAPRPLDHSAAALPRGRRGKLRPRRRRVRPPPGRCPCAA